MKIKLGTQEKDGVTPVKPSSTAVVAPQGVPCARRCNVHPEFNRKVALTVGGLYILSGLVGMVVASVVHWKIGHGCGWHLHTAFVASIITGGLGLGAACKKRRGLIITFMVFAIITMIIVVLSSMGSVKKMHEMKKHYMEHDERRSLHGDMHGKDSHGKDSHDKDGHDKGAEHKREWMKRHRQWKMRKHHRPGHGSHDEDEKRWNMHGDKRQSPGQMKAIKRLVIAGAVSMGVLHLIEFIISIISIVICCRVTGNCRKRRAQTNACNYQVPTPGLVPSAVESAPLPAELDAKILAEENYMKTQVPPANHQGDLPIYEPPPYVDDGDKKKLTDVNV